MRKKRSVDGMAGPVPSGELERPLYLRICDNVVQAIRSGALKPGQRIPSIRAMAKELQASHNTVEVAYDILISDGYLEARGQAGTYVLDQAGTEPRREARPWTDLSVLALYGAAGESDVRPFQVGLPALDLFPRKLWTNLNVRQARTTSHMLSYPDPEGLAELRRAISSYLNLSRGLQCAPEQVFVTSGFRMSLDLLLEEMVTPLDGVLIEDPCFPPSRAMLTQRGAELVPVPVDAEGMCVEAGLSRAPGARLALVTPGHQSPLGATLSEARRRTLLDWAGRTGALVVEDDYDSEFRYDRRWIPALASQDEHGVVFLAGTFSKTLCPAVGLGYLVVPERFIGQFQAAVARRGNTGSVLIQSALGTMMEQGHFSRHIRKMRAVYACRRNFLAMALVRAFGSRAKVEMPTSGLNILARLSHDEDDVALAAQAREAGFGVSPLSPRAIEADCGKGLLLGFANLATQQQADALVAKLMDAFDPGERPDPPHRLGRRPSPRSERWRLRPLGLAPETPSWQESRR